jgi:hypothetical protein
MTARRRTSATTSSTRSWVRRRRSPLLASGIGLLVLLASCAAPREGADADPYRDGLWAERPVVELAFDVAPDRRAVLGHEAVVFTPDLSTCELVFRAWPNNPTISRAGSSLTVTGAGVDGQPVVPRVLPAGSPADAPGTLVELPLPACLEPGRPVRADLDFRLVLGVNADERVGSNPDSATAWFGTGFPLLAWARGQGWVRDPAVDMNGETVTSEDFTLATLSITAPTDDRVLGTGSAAGSTPGPEPGTTTHRFTAPATRDVAVAVGRYAVRDRDVGGVRLHLATPERGTRATPEEWSAEIERAVTTLSRTLGPFPYPDLWVAITPGQSDGTEFPTALQFGDVGSQQLPGLVAHELAHQWFYALVGSNQARDPWLDESLATFAEGLVTRRGDDEVDPEDLDGLLGEPMSYWAENGGFRRYTRTVYDGGAAVFLEARRRAGAERFDAALRGYVAAQAHRVATPQDLERAFADQPAVVDLLVEAGATARPG